MASSEDCQLTDLQSEFKKLRVDLNNLCQSKPAEDCCRKPSLGANKEQDPSPLSSSRSEHCRCGRTAIPNSRLILKKRKKRCLKKKQTIDKNPEGELFVLNEILQAIKQTQGCPEEGALDNTSEDASQEHSDDTTVDELAGYFDNLVYIPKKMSQMAEMMYT